MQQSASHTEEFDVVIVGAGPAGCMAARRLGRRLRVLLVDSSSLPRNKPCGGALNHYSWEFLRDFPIPKKLFVDPEEVSFRWVDFDRKVSRTTRLVFKNVSRSAFDEWMLSLVPLSVSVRDVTRFLGFEATGEGAEVRLESAYGQVAVLTRFLIGADGALSQVRRRVTGEEQITYSCVQDWVDRLAPMPAHFDCIRLRDGGEGHAYAYVVPKGDQALVGSVFYPDTTGQKGKHDGVMKRLRDGLGLGESTGRESAAALQVRSRRDVVLGSGNVLLAGEAAGFISPTSGEGISYALSTGDQCGRAILTDPANALAEYSVTAQPAVRNIAAKVRKITLLEHRAGHAVLAAMPLGLLSRLTMRL